MTFKKVNPKQSFPKLEEEVLAYWQENKTFERSVDTRSECDEFAFYDGPPFATGTPHYGHILAGTMKDVIPRYQTMKGKRVERVFGWDCHGLPIENIVEKKLNISGKDDIEKKIGVYEFNEACRANVFGYVDEWKEIVQRTGRWVDMEHDYKTMDKEFMESVWWVFKSIYDKGLIYEGHRVVPYCPRCSTPLSNFEVNQGYKDKQSKTLTVRFKVKNSENKYILAWTTTPWTLYANLGLAVGKDITYVELTDKATGDTYILAHDRVSNYYKNEDDYTIVREYPGSCLVGIKYEPIFDDFNPEVNPSIYEINGIEKGENSFSVVLGHHVTTESGTGVVHIAPAYGEDDYIIGQNEKLGFVSHIDDTGKTMNLLCNNGIYVFDFNNMVIDELKARKDAIHIGTIDHSYPHCWRCDTPLIYRGISAWYVAVEKIRDKMVANNQKMNWVPSVIKEGRFGKWLENARDWNISRNRYWGSAIPVWQSEDKSEEVCIGSIEELYELNKEYGQIEKRPHPNPLLSKEREQEVYQYFYTNTGKEIDLHKHFVDDIKIKHPKTGTELKRIPEVLDCWFESGAMPYASKHYPFAFTSSQPSPSEEKEQAQLNSPLLQRRGARGEVFRFPADFIAEGLDQTRGWFYTLIILSTALFDSPAALNTIVNGIVLAEDGKKMSKSLKNYPDPKHILNNYGADAMRFYLMNSPVVEAQDLRFAESGVEEVVKKVILPLWNTYSFFTTYANIDKFEPEAGNTYFLRHGETDRNSGKVMNPGDVDSVLNKNGISQAIEAGRKAKAAGINFDIIISSPLQRTLDTANYIAKELGYNSEIIVDKRFAEQDAGVLKDYSHEQIRKEFSVQTNYEMRKVYKSKEYNKVEDVVDFDNRVLEAYKEVRETYRGKNVLIVGHTGSFRPINRYLNDLSMDEAHYKLESIPHSQIIKLVNYTKSNKLDKWIVSELHKLIHEVSDGLDNYKLNEASRPIVKFMDNLTNWYIRRSRKRFWKSESDNDKLEAYNTLYDVLVELTKVIAPFMPFVSEYIYKELTKRESVHLDLFPQAVKSWIFDDLNNDTDKVQKIITLGLAWRANSKIRVRQPLASITIGESLEDYYIEIIKEELNVKEVIVVDPSSIAKKICKPNGRVIGPKFGSDVKFIMSEAKAGNFEELENGNIKVGHFELEPGDFEIVFEAGDSNYNIEAGFGMVIAMDSEITPELKLEGYARDIVRYVQEARKEAEYNVDDRIYISLKGKEESEKLVEEILNKFGAYIESETLSSITSLPAGDLEKELELEDVKVRLILKK
ncbi:MAG: isoleucine--tRNA ligase [Candidatus Gracilibacteria bacterium]|nr:isoleucine--tRNA ligase [Candidatus Gracilibacteria bacterium]